MDSIGDILRRNLPDGIVTERIPPDAEALLDPRRYPPRPVVERLIAEVERDLAQMEEGTLMRRRLADRLDRYRRMLEGCARRDALAADRPEGCWCLGRGWRVAIPEDATDARILYCDCDAGHAARARHAAQDVAAERERRRVRIERLWRTAGLDDVLGSMTGATWLAEIARRHPTYAETAREILDQVQRWITTDEWLFLDGPFGRGKTVLLALICRRLLESGVVVIWQNGPDLFERLRRAQHEEGGSDAIYAPLVAADVLAVDDLDKVRPTEWVIETFYRIVNARYLARSRTLFSANLAVEDRALGERVGHAALHRIVQRCGASGLVTLRGPNLRLDPSTGGS